MSLDQDFLDRALRKLKEPRHPVGRFCEIQRLARVRVPFQPDHARRTFNGFYRVRRSPAWQKEFFDLFPKVRRMAEKGESSMSLLTWSVSELEKNLRRSDQVSRVESSFCSKLVATYHPEAAVIDSVVLKYFSIPLPSRKKGTGLKLDELKWCYKALEGRISEVAHCLWGERWLKMFDDNFGNTVGFELVSTTKKVDFLVWAGADRSNR
ncbi:hypothetical protein [Sinorhizobium meliloti]|uniref:hypothetical protein n=1 Tax=Rhizobium meliloti TaxID=382 RepID=UPI00299F0C22|nr:hypothetical protein [Sinorhizobium meliloti]